MTIAMRHVVKFPANVQGTKGIDVSRKNGTFTFKLDYEDLTPAVSVASNVNVAFQDPFTGEMGVTSLSSALNSNSNIQAIANASTVANKLGYWNGVSSYALADFSAFGRTWIGIADAAAGRTALGVPATTDLGTAAAANVGDFATAAQGSTADSAVQPGDLATVATSGAYSDLTGKPTLGTAAALDTGTTAGKVVALDGSGKLPAVDGSQLTGLPGGGDLLAANNGSDFVDKQATALNLGAAIFNSTSDAVAATIPSGVRTLSAGGQPYVKVLDQNAPGLGANILLDPGFDTGTGWTVETGWTISGGSAARTNTGTITRVYYSAVAPIVGQAYLVAVDVPSITSGQCLIQIGQTNSADISTAGTYYFVLTAANTNYFSVFGRETFAGYVDNVVARPLPIGALQSADGAWWVPLRAEGRLNVKWFGAKGDGVTDDTVALWNAIAAVSYGFGHTVFIPAGRYKVTSTLGYTNTSPGTAGIAIEGEDPTTSVLVYSGTGDCISFDMGTNTYRTTNRVAVRRLGIVAADTKPAATGAAISVYRSAVSSVTPGNLFEDLYIWQEASSWEFGIYQSNAQESYFNRLYIMLINNEQGAAVRVENSTTQASYGLFFKDCSFNGGEYGLYATGWVESVFMEGCGWAGQVRPVFLDGSSVSAGCPHFTATNCHLNAKETTIYTQKWRSIFLTGCDIYSGVGSGDRAGNNLICNDASFVQVTGCKMENGAAGSYTRDGIAFSEVQKYIVTGCNISSISGTGILVSGSTSIKGTITGNIINGLEDGTPNDNGVYIAGTAGEAIVANNVIAYFATPASLFDSYCSLTGNIARGCTNSYVVSGTGSVNANNIG